MCDQTASRGARSLDVKRTALVKSARHDFLFEERDGGYTMPFSYSISPMHKVAYVTARGAVDLRAAMDAMGRIRKDPGFDPDYGVLVDASDMEYSPTAGEIGVLEWALGHEKTSYRSRIAVIRPQEGRETMRDAFMRLAARTGIELGLFPNRESALEWVGVH